VLQDSDLKAFLNAFEASGALGIAPTPPHSVLSKDDGIFSSEVWRLVCSLQIAAALGDAPQLAAAAAQVILDNVRDLRCAPLSDQRAWSQAIAWALAQPALADPTALVAPLGREREWIVGAACLRLRERGYKVEVGAYGPQLTEASRRELVRSAEALVGVLGGFETAAKILRFLRDANFYHDGLWLFGEVGLNLYDAKRPMIPVGWLFSLALRNLDRPGGARKPEVAWKSLVDLATNFAAVHDCQRYSQFDGMNLHPSQLHHTLAASTLWRELFTLPQMPPKALHQVLDALVTVLTRDDQEQLGFSPRVLFKEILLLLEWSADDRLTIHPRAEVERSLPVLCRLTGGAAATVNAGYSDPLAASERTQDITLLFAFGRDRAITLPRAFLATAACTFIVEFIWSKLGKRAKDVVGSTLERAIEDACRGKAPAVFPHCCYFDGKDRYELDVATRDADRIVLMETKGKALTRQSRSGDMFKFFEDYSDSFLRMLSQLVRREIHLRQGCTPLTVAGEAVDALRPLKVAVSPLNYGPVSDKMLSSSLIRSLVGVRLTLVTPDEANQQIIDTFNRRTKALFDDIALVAPKKDGLADLLSYLIDVFWLDLGQLLYVLDRANTVWDAFRPLKHITFSSRDFWTELAHADRSGLTVGKWRQVT
jgi:hypothetical protein